MNNILRALCLFFFLSMYDAHFTRYPQYHQMRPRYVNTERVTPPEEIIDEEDILKVETRNYYDKYSFKTNWALSWEDSDVW